MTLLLTVFKKLVGPVVAHYSAFVVPLSISVAQSYSLCKCYRNIRGHMINNQKERKKC